MSEENDGIAEALEGQLQVLITAAGQIAERIARSREAALRSARDASEQETRELQSHFAAELRTAQAAVKGVHQRDWWDNATQKQISHTYQAAHAWGREDPDVARAEQKMKDELRSRYGVDVDNTNTDPAAARIAAERAERDRVQAGTERNLEAAEIAEAQRLMTQADQEEHRADEARDQAEHEPNPDEQARDLAEAEDSHERGGQAREDSQMKYDSAARRKGTAHDLESKGIDGETVATRMRADVSQAKPATTAVKAGAAKAPRAHTSRGSRGAQIQPSGLDR